MNKTIEITTTQNVTIEYELAELREQVPPGVVAMLRVPGLGPKKVFALFHEHGIKSLDELRLAVGLAEHDGERGIEGTAERLDLGQRRRAVDLRLARAQAIEVGTVQHEDRTHGRYPL